MGFSLLETLLTLLLITLTATVMLWRWPSDDDTTGRALQLAGSIRLTQTLAMGQGGNWLLTLLPPSQYKIRNIINNVEFPYLLGTVQLLNPAALEIRFNQDGSPLTGVGQYTLSNGQLQRTFTLEPVTGSVFLNPP